MTWCRGALGVEGMGALPRASDWCVGLDLGLKRDPTALLVVEKKVRKTGRRDAVSWAVELEEVTMIRRVERVLRGLPDKRRPTVLVDATGGDHGWAECRVGEGGGCEVRIADIPAFRYD